MPAKIHRCWSCLSHDKPQTQSLFYMQTTSLMNIHSFMPPMQTVMPLVPWPPNSLVGNVQAMSWPCLSHVLKSYL